MMEDLEIVSKSFFITSFKGVLKYITNSYNNR